MNSFTMKSRSQIVIDGREFSGNSISISGDGSVIVDGVVQEGALVGPVNVTLHGDAESIETTSGAVTVSGKAGSVKTMSGSVKCGDVSGEVKTMSGDVNCGSISGGARSMSGDVRHR